MGRKANIIHEFDGIENDEDIIDILAKKYDMNRGDVRILVNEQFRFCTKKMLSGDKRGTMLYYLGKFVVNKYRDDKEIN